MKYKFSTRGPWRGFGGSMLLLKVKISFLRSVWWFSVKRFISTGKSLYWLKFFLSAFLSVFLSLTNWEKEKIAVVSFYTINSKYQIFFFNSLIKVKALKKENCLLCKAFTSEANLANMFMHTFYNSGSQNSKNSVKLSVSFCTIGICMLNSCA